jgi:hypothetical protein
MSEYRSLKDAGGSSPSTFTKIIIMKDPGIIVFPHVRYISSTKNHNPHCIYKTYIGDHDMATNGEVYQFHPAQFSPRHGEPRREVWITKSDIGPYIRYEDTIEQWADVKLNETQDED